MEFATYQIDKFPEDIFNTDNLDKTWFKISLIEDADGNKYKEFPKIMVALMIVPHSNAATERIFSIIKKKKWN